MDSVRLALSAVLAASRGCSFRGGGATAQQKRLARMVLRGRRALTCRQTLAGASVNMENALSGSLEFLSFARACFANSKS